MVKLDHLYFANIKTFPIFATLKVLGSNTVKQMLSGAFAKLKKNKMDREIKINYILQDIITKEYFSKKFDYAQVFTGEARSGLNICNAVIIAKRQYTGLKDKNGKELYQNDIIKYISENDGESEFISEIDANLYDGIQIKSAALHLEFAMYEDFLRDGNFEIIGNIYSNPELINK